MGNVHGGLWIGLARSGVSRRYVLWDACVRDASALFGVSLDRDALGTLRTDEVIDDIARKRVAEIALRRRRRKSSN